MALVADERWAEAAGAALAVSAQGELGGSVRVLSACLPDPETVVVGGLACVDLGRRDYLNDSRRGPLLGLLLSLPGDGRVEMLTRLAALAPHQAVPMYFRALARCVAPGPFPTSKKNGRIQPVVGYGWTTSSDNLDQVAVESVGKPAQKAALDFLCAQVSPELSITAGEYLAKIFRSKRRPESIPALRRLLDHPSMSVAQEAADALKSLGQEAEIPAKLGPVRYAIRLNGTPYANRKVRWDMRLYGTGTGSEATTDAAGVIELPRDDFLDPSPELALSPASIDSPSDPWFGIVLPAPPATDDIIPVEVKTSSLRVELPLPRPKEDGKTMTVVLSGLEVPGASNPMFWRSAKFHLPVSESVEFDKLGPGTYRAEIRIPGATSWTGELRAGEAPTFTVPLERATDVKFAVVPPPGWPVNAFLPELWQNGQRVSADWDYENQFFHGVCEGKYVLHIPSSEDFRKRGRGLLPDGPEFPISDTPFEVGLDSPAEIDLGEIRVVPAP